MGGVFQLTPLSAESDDDGREASDEDSYGPDASDSGGEESEVDA